MLGKVIREECIKSLYDYWKKKDPKRLWELFKFLPESAKQKLLELMKQKSLEEFI